MPDSSCHGGGGKGGVRFRIQSACIQEKGNHRKCQAYPQGTLRDGHIAGRKTQAGERDVRVSRNDAEHRGGERSDSQRPGGIPKTNGWLDSSKRLKLREKLGNIYEDLTERIIERSEYELLKQNYCMILSQLDESIRVEKSLSENEDVELLSEKRRLQRQKQGFIQRQISVYESYREGKLDKAEFLDRKAEIKAESEKTEVILHDLEKQISTVKSDVDEVGRLPVTKYAALDVYDKRIMASLIEKAEVMGEDTLQVTWKHQDEYDRILGLIS